MIIPGMCGFFPPVFAPSGPVLTSATFKAQANADSSVITIPVGARAAGNLAVLYWMDSGNVAHAAPAGWTELGGLQSTWTMFDYAKILDGSETTVTMPNGVGRAVLAVFEGDVPIAGFSVGAPFSAEYTTGKPAAQSVLAAGKNTPLIVLGQRRHSGGTSGASTGTFPAGRTELTGSTATHNCSYQIFNSAPEDQTFDMNDNGTNNMIVTGMLLLS